MWSAEIRWLRNTKKLHFLKDLPADSKGGIFYFYFVKYLPEELTDWCNYNITMWSVVNINIYA